MKKRMKILAMPFSTEDFVELEAWGKDNWRKADVQVLEWQCMGALHQEVARSAVRNTDAEGILIVRHEEMTAKELEFVVRYLADLDKKLYTTSGGLTPMESHCEIESMEGMGSNGEPDMVFDSKDNGHRDACSI